MATNSWYSSLIVTIILSLYNSASGQSQAAVTMDGGTSTAAQLCAQMIVCRECITLPNCIWCSQPDFDGAHCMDRESVSRSNCSQDQIQDPHGFVNRSTMAHSQQISPTAVQMSLRVGEPQSFTVQVTPNSDYPLDLYILMDLSRSMQDDLEMIRTLLDDLTTRLGEITSDFHLGFGAFNEKPLLPFTVRTRFVISPTMIIESTDYSYRHVVSLTSNITKFRNSINAISTFTNHDDPEAMLEALLQVAVCKDVIGWREAARKLILVMTDQGFHTAGDGRLGGLHERNDGNCYVPRQNSSGLPVDYQMWDVFDYPSVGQVQAKLRENDIILIIASISIFQPTYEAMVNLMPGAYFQVLSGNSANFLDIIENSYNTTSQTVELAPSPAQGVEFRINASCASAQRSEDNICTGVHLGQTVRFEVQVTLTRCLSMNDPSSVIHIPGFGSINVGITPLCSCPCEVETVNKELNSTECRGNGHISCGVCECLLGRFGSQCQCTSEVTVNLPCPPLVATSHLKHIKLTPWTTTKTTVWGPLNHECNGRGLCECGVCICNQPNPAIVPQNVSRAMYYGDACECDNFNCPVIDGQICNGRGECSCGACVCSSSMLDDSVAPYRGSGCECPPEEEICLNPEDGMICSNHGRCLCDECFCDVDFAGEFCNISTRSIPLDCGGRTCVECAKGLLPSSECAIFNCSVVLIEEVAMTDYTINGLETIECSFVDSSGCHHFYFVARGQRIEAEKTQVCSGGTNLALPIWAIAAIIVGGLLLLGLLIIVAVKLILFWLDRREYNAWKSELKTADFGMGRNPLYTSCQKDYKNVAYKSDSGLDNQYLWRPALSEVENEVPFDDVDGSLVKANLNKSDHESESVENLLYEKSTTV